MKTTLSILFAIAIFLWVANVKIKFSPFSITFGDLHFAVGLLLVGLGIGLIGVSFYKQGVRDHQKMVVGVLDELGKEKAK